MENKATIIPEIDPSTFNHFMMVMSGMYFVGKNENGKSVVVVPDFYTKCKVSPNFDSLKKTFSLLSHNLKQKLNATISDNT